MMTKEESREALCTMIDEALAGRLTAVQFCQQLLDAGAGVWAAVWAVPPSLQPDLHGFTFDLGGQTFRGSELSKDYSYSFQRLLARGLSYQAERDLPGLADFQLSVTKKGAAGATGEQMRPGSARPQANVDDFLARHARAQSDLESSLSAFLHLLAGFSHAVAVSVCGLINLLLKACGVSYRVVPPVLQSRDGRLAARVDRGGAEVPSEESAVAMARAAAAVKRVGVALQNYDSEKITKGIPAAEADVVCREFAHKQRVQKLADALPDNIGGVEAERQRLERSYQEENRDLKIEATWLRQRQLENRNAIQSVLGEQQRLREEYLDELPDRLRDLEEVLCQMEAAGAPQAEIDLQVEVVNQVRTQHGMPLLEDQAELAQRQTMQVHR